MLKGYQIVVKNRNFLRIWFSQISSQVAINIMNFIFIIALFEKTGSTIATSLLWISYALPAIIVGPVSAAFIDIVDKRKVLITTNLVQSTIIFVYSLHTFDNYFSLYVLAFVYSMINQFYVPAESSTVPSVVEKESLPQANGLFFLTQQIAMVFGFGIAGILKKYLGFKQTMMFSAALLFMAFLSVILLPKMKTQYKLPKKFEDTFIRFFRKIFEGYSYIKTNKMILVPILTLMIFQAFLAIIVVNLPLIATSLLRIDANLAGIYLIVPAGLGAIVGALFVPLLMKKGVRKKIIVNNFLKSLIISTLIIGLVSFVHQETFRHVFSVLSVMLIGISYLGIIIPCYTFLQEHTPGGYRGRVFGNFWFLSTIVTVFPVVFSGTISEYLGIRTLLSVLIFALLTTLFLSKKYGSTILLNEDEK